MQRTHFLRAALGAAMLAVAAGSFAQAYPAKPVRMVIPFPPGGTLDTVGRQLAQRLGEQMGQSFIVENKPGGNGVIGGDVVAKAPADGYTLLFNASTFTTAPMTMKSVPYGVVKDFTPVALVAKAPLSVAINKNLPVTDIKSLMAYAKANPGKMTFAVGSIGSAGHLSTELLKRAGNLDYLIVPYKGTAPAFQDLIGGQIDGFIDPILGSLQYHKSGMLRVVAVTSAQRAASLPDVPTVAETIPGYEFYSWYGLW
ncbi:MAG TPA: tripartite tricarboxylate transporter substrate binding protein, partial [Acidovorax sp.]|nr:tripartite tricarboxylate transporter substrate binding protein [Acidovorax sp.]